MPAAQALEDVGLGPKAHQLAARLAHGERRQLEMAMALVSQPKLLLLDEPMAGMGRHESEAMVKLLAGLKERYAMLLIEHDMDAVFALADRITVLVYGRAIATGTPEAIRANPEVSGPILASAMLRVDAIEAAYDRIQVLFGTSFEVGAGEAVALLGRNGMGKTTTVHCIIGAVAARAARSASTVRGSTVCRRTASRASVSASCRRAGRFPDAHGPTRTWWRRQPTAAASPIRGRSTASTSSFPSSAERHNQLGGALSGGEQQMLAIGRALMLSPSSSSSTRRPKVWRR